MTNFVTLDIPTLHRRFIGFDQLFEELNRTFTTAAKQDNYPPHNVIRTGENLFRIEVAVAGFDEGEINVSVDNRKLIITGDHVSVEAENWEYLYRGLSRRNFVQKFPLMEHVEVKDASVKNGILTIYLERIVPEEKKPKHIAINYNK